MLETMYVRCTHCGYDNSPEYRFCGMCGASLAHPPVAAKTGAREAARSESQSEETEANSNGNAETVHGPSFLGLAQDPKDEFHYLYEDEPPRSYAGLIFILILLVAVGGFGYWQWRHNGFPFNRLSALRGSPSQSASPSEVSPAQSQEQQTNIPKPMTGAGDVTPAPAGQTAKPPDTGKTTEFPAQGGQNAAPAAAQTNAVNPPAPSPEEKAPAKSDEAAATNSPKPEKATKSRTRHHADAAPAPETTATSTTVPASPDADLEQAGERYLYGNGLPQNCARAESALSTAATHGNSKAQTVLGTMYAAGHCVGRDLPTAYRWYARALHQEPQNSRIAEDLQVLWREMTPQEKQLATTGGQ